PSRPTPGPAASASSSSTGRSARNSAWSPAVRCWSSCSRCWSSRSSRCSAEWWGHGGCAPARPPAAAEPVPDVHESRRCAMATPTRITAAAAVPLLLAASACGASDPYSEGGAAGGSDGALVVGSADFPESTLLANIYAQALENAGQEVETKLNIGSRAVYYDQIESGNLSVLAEYSGCIRAYREQEAGPGEQEQSNKRVEAALPDGLSMLDSSAAENEDSVTATRKTAENDDLAEIGDLADV